MKLNQGWYRLHVDKYRVNAVFEVKNVCSQFLDEQRFTVII